jgi:kumamolisin
VSNSWGEPEYDGDSADEANFSAPNTVFFASTGDRAGTETPSVFPNVVAVGGTTIKRAHDGSFLQQTAWSDGGGGSSAFPVPAYQALVKGLAKRLRKHRGAPDVSMDADSNSGVVIYDSYPYQLYVYGWLVIGGTSVASPLTAGVINAAGSFAASTEDELTTIYGGYPNASNWTDITSGICGNNDASLALRGYDFCTGLGVPRGYGGK